LKFQLEHKYTVWYNIWSYSIRASPYGLARIFRENRRFDPLGLARFQGGPGKITRMGKGKVRGTVPEKLLGRFL